MHPLVGVFEHRLIYSILHPLGKGLSMNNANVKGPSSHLSGHFPSTISAQCTQHLRLSHTTLPPHHHLHSAGALPSPSASISDATRKTEDMASLATMRRCWFTAYLHPFILFWGLFCRSCCCGEHDSLFEFELPD
ncbi:hypothetical protein Hdeb2414_s0021g00578191 [Helianthus debilis subsp. tardiflorus]